MKKITAKNPPMGWNSFICLNWSATEAEIKANADYMAKNLKQFGCEYIVLDFIWSMDGDHNSPNPNQDENYEPRLHMDEYGRLIPSPERFPSSVNGMGLNPVSDYVHSLGLKFGLHIMRGVPRQSVHDQNPIKGSDKSTADIANTGSTCIWLNHMYGLDMENEASQAYLNSLFELYAEWGVDYIKVDDLSFPYYKSEIEGYRKAIDSCGREIVFSTSPGETTLDEAEHIGVHANLWRISADFWDRWGDLKSQFVRLRDWTPFRKEGAWPDADMLPIGKLAMRGPVGETRMSDFTKDEQYTLMSLWSVANSPLMMGGYLPDNDEFTLSLLTNAELIDVNQNFRGGHEVYSCDGIVMWISESQTSQKYSVAVFNINDEACIVKLADIGFPSGAYTDIWTKEEITIDSETSVKIPPHGTKMYISKI